MPVIVVVGFGPGISSAVAERFGAEGFAVALVGRTAAGLDAGVAALQARGIAAGAFPADAGDPAAITAALDAIRGALGPITVLHWNAISGQGSGDLLTAEGAAEGVFDVAIDGLLAAVRAALPDLKAAGDGAVLVTNGAYGDPSPQIDALAVRLKAMGVALANAAKAKLVGLLSARLKDEGVYVGEVTVAGAVAGTAWAPAGGGIPGATIADRFWTLYKARTAVRARVEG